VLAHIEEQDGVAEAWMSRDGTLVVVVPDRGQVPDAAAIRAMLADGGDAYALDGTNRDTVLAMFADHATWVRAHSADALSAEEAVVVARRIASRVAAHATLGEEDRNALEAIVRRRFTTGALDAGTVEEAARFLDEGGVAALQDALAQGVAPLPGE
jgi:hypothetical protein